MYFSDFGENLRHLRKSHHLTQKDFGAKVGLTKAVVSKYENGMGYPSYDVLVRIAQYFGVTTDYMLGVERGKTVDVSDLTDSQIAVIHQIITEFKTTNKK